MTQTIDIARALSATRIPWARIERTIGRRALLRALNDAATAGDAELIRRAKRAGIDVATECAW